MKVCYIFTGGVMNGGDLKAFELSKPDCVISADAGYLYAEKYGFSSDWLIGDFDTLETIPQDLDTTKILGFPIEKDDTDTMLAAKQALSLGCDRIVIFGALGGRLDHQLANIQTLAFIAENGGRGEIVSTDEYVTLLSPGSYDFPQKDGYSFSVFSYSDECLGVTEKGFKYQIENVRITNGFPIGASNEITEDFGTISFEKGKLLVVISKKSNLFQPNE